jgi:hypothetical protein
MKVGRYIVKLLQNTDGMVNSKRRNFLKQGFVIAYSGLFVACESDNNSPEYGSASAEETGQAPSIISEPSDISVDSGQSATFHVVAAGTEPLRYQWQKDGVSIAGATSSSYTTPVLGVDDSASVYSVVVENDKGSAISRDAVVTVVRNSISVDLTSITIDSTQVSVDAT